MPMLGFSFGAYHLCLAVAFSYQFRVGHKYRGQQLLAYLAVGADNEDETRISYLPINFNKSVDEAIECTTHCINTGQLMCRIDFDTTINDQTYSSIKNAYPFLTRLLQSLGSGNNFSAIEIFNNSSERFLSNNVTNQIIVFYPDTGAAVLARRDWQLDTDEALVPSSIIHTGSLEYDDLSINDKLAIVLCPQYSEVDNVLRVMNLCAERSVPCILINPSLINMDQGFGVSKYMKNINCPTTSSIIDVFFRGS